jgi:hypothetical protein
MNDTTETIVTENSKATTLTWSSSEGTHFIENLNKLDWNSPAVAQLEFPGGNFVISLNKKLNLVQRMCYNVLGFKYKTL